MVYISLLVTTKQTPILDTQKIKESKHTPTKTKKNKKKKPSKRKTARHEGTKELQCSQRIMNKMAIISLYLSIHEL